MNLRRAIVIGASAGGLEGLTAIVRGQPADIPAAFFVVLHVSRRAPSFLPEILARATKLSVLAAQDGLPIQAGHVYVAPPDHHMLVQGGALRLSRGPVENGHRPAIDPLFRAAARVYGARTIGVVLSGSLDDGTAGIIAIRRVGGTTVVQSPEEAMFPSMPLSALQNARVDFVLPAAEIGGLVQRLTLEPPKAEAVAGSHNDLLEDAIAQQDPGAAHEMQREGTPSPFVCPDCGGTLFELNDTEWVRYRCRVGHAYGLDGLIDQKAAHVEGALWSAVRALEESSDAARRAAARARHHGSEREAEDLERKGELESQRAAIVRGVIAKGSPA